MKRREDEKAKTHYILQSAEDATEETAANLRRNLNTLKTTQSSNRIVSESR